MLIGLSGKSLSGKDYFSKILTNKFSTNYGVDFKCIAYADSLKQKLMEEFNLSYDQVYGDKKEQPDLRYPKNIKINNISDLLTEDGKVWTDKDLYWSPRELMQFIGTDCYRIINNNFWVDYLFNTIQKKELKNVIITDCRFPNEVDAVVDRGGIHIKIIRPNSSTTKHYAHASEVCLDNDYRVDYTVINDADHNKLEQYSVEIYKKLLNKGGMLCKFQ